MARRGAAEVLSDGHRFLEAPRWHSGQLYASDFYTRRVLRWGPERRPVTVREVPGEPSGLGWEPSGNLLVVSMTDRRLLRLVAGELVEVTDLRDRVPWHLNDMAVDPDGRAYIGNLGWNDEIDRRIQPTVLLRVDSDGSVAVAAEDLVNPNGMAITPDGRTLMVAETFAARVTAFAIGDGGVLGRPSHLGRLRRPRLRDDGRCIRRRRPAAGRDSARPGGRSLGRGLPRIRREQGR